MTINTLKNTYAEKAINQIPRLLGNMDRNPYSPTFGCFHRDYWLDKTSDFPDAVRQFGVHALALVYKNEFPGNIYLGQKKIKDWTVAAMLFWAKIQHKDGSFDEFYPYERGWVGPTAFTNFTIIEAFNILHEEMSEKDKDIMLKAIKKAAYFIAKGENEEDHLANHHAMACLALWKSYELLKEEPLKTAYNSAFETFLKYHRPQEGWSREYDGVDPGYLSATVSFFAKIYKTNKDPRILKVIEESVKFSQYFVYPNGFYAGSMGSRNTLHFYCDGYEIMSKEIPLAASIAEKLLKGLSENKLVPPEIISDRYVFYRVPEFLEAYLDYKERDHQNLPLLPFEETRMQAYFPLSRIFVKKENDIHIISNLSKGGVIKVFKGEKLIYNNCGVIGKIKEKEKTVTSQWVDPQYKAEANENGWIVEGDFNTVPSNKLFTPLKNIIFRGVLLFTSWSSWFSHFLKGQIRKTLILGQRKIPVSFMRELKHDENKIIVKDYLSIKGSVKFESLSVGDEFFVRYVPQSRYFQSQELEVEGYEFTNNQLNQFNENKKITIIQSINTETMEVSIDIQ